MVSNHLKKLHKSNWIISPKYSRHRKKTCLKPPPSLLFGDDCLDYSGWTWNKHDHHLATINPLEIKVGLSKICAQTSPYSDSFNRSKPPPSPLAGLGTRQLPTPLHVHWNGWKKPRENLTLVVNSAELPSSKLTNRHGKIPNSHAYLWSTWWIFHGYVYRSVVVFPVHMYDC